MTSSLYQPIAAHFCANDEQMKQNNDEIENSFRNQQYRHSGGQRTVGKLWKRGRKRAFGRERSSVGKSIHGTIVSGGNNFELYFEYDHVEQICEKLKAENVEFVHELREQPWKQLVVRFYDPDKNIIEIGESLEHLVFRLKQQNYSVDEISKMTGLDKEFIEKTLQINS